MEEKKSHSTLVGTAIAIVLVVLLLLVLTNNLQIGRLLSPGESTSTFTNSPVGNGTSPTNIEITYPSNYAVLATYTLAIINQNRTSMGLGPVVLSPIPSGQDHADSMLQNGYFSHWDTQGYKPYMRYSILNGTGYVEENVAYEHVGLPSFLSTQNVEKAIGKLEWQMMNNDSACCNNGHRDNILNQYHNRVSIGIAYNANYLYLVQDFETYFTALSTPVVQGSTVVLEGNALQALSPNSVEVYYDPPPTTISPYNLSTQYNTAYGPGTFVGGVVPTCNNIFQTCMRFDQGITVSATTWHVGSSGIDIQFSLTNFIATQGDGVYTLYLVQGGLSSPEYLTSISVFVTN